MIPQVMHPMFAKPVHDEAARQGFVNDFRVHLASQIFPGNIQGYFKRVLPAFVKENKREPKDRHEVRRVMTKDPYYQLWSAMQRSSQEMIWDSVIDSVERQLPDLIAKAAALKGKGSLTIDPKLEIPRYNTAADIHLQPGAYHGEAGQNDLSAGAIYDRGTFIYSMGALGEHNDGLGRILHGFFRKQWPDRKIERVLDMGCTIGGSVSYWSQKEPNVEFHAVDLGAACLRYGHARAKAVGANVHFSQQNAEKTNFPDASFDLVTSHILLHETSRPAIHNIMKECHRLLKPGGLMLHLDLPQAAGQSPLEGFLWEWEVYNNNEHFYGQLRELDVAEVCAKAGFDKATFKIHQVSSTWDDGQTPYSDENFTFPVYTAEK
ncbi:MAG: class I SAM-dependent methyltransferase [Alphaproteobacteria bacterium]|nr:class I SAM-dependent methyltransferase [Alphaproteobacteria bacterium]